jgi:phage baseplate assembly protein W
MATKTIAPAKIFSDIPTNLTIHPKKKDLLMVTNEEAVKNSIRNLVQTNTYERVMQPDVGGNVIGLLFENFSRLTISQLETKIEATILNYEPRANLISVVASPAMDENSIGVTIVFAVIGNNRPVEFNILLERQR